jgi:hypothetical protein
MVFGEDISEGLYDGVDEESSMVFEYQVVAIEGVYDIPWIAADHLLHDPVRAFFVGNIGGPCRE